MKHVSRAIAHLPIFQTAFLHFMFNAFLSFLEEYLTCVKAVFCTIVFAWAESSCGPFGATEARQPTLVTMALEDKGEKMQPESSSLLQP